jgi:hypothetical protein
VKLKHLKFNWLHLFCASTRCEARAKALQHCARLRCLYFIWLCGSSKFALSKLTTTQCPNICSCAELPVRCSCKCSTAKHCNDLHDYPMVLQRGCSAAVVIRSKKTACVTQGGLSALVQLHSSATPQVVFAVSAPLMKQLV